ncbi:MAG: hypothetical protein LBD58_04765 [Treponema sp.]|nr:hypothetical protein [Treponema sp.]
MTVLSKTVANSPATLSDKIDLQAGVFGHFSITWGKVTAGIAVGVYATGETGACLSKSLFSSQSNTNKGDDKNNVSNNASTEIRKTASPVNIGLKLFSSPPIHIGVIYIKLTWNGSIDIPIEVYASGDIVTTLYAGFTAFYAAGFDLVVDYGVTYKKIKILWATISIPTGVRFDWDVEGNIVDDLAYYAGVIGDIRGGGK